MPLQSKKRLLLLSLLSLSLLNCSVKPPNVFVFESLEQHLKTDDITKHIILSPSPTCMAKIGEPACLHGVAIMSGEEIYVGELPGHFFNGKKASAIKAESIYVPAVESFSPLKTYIVNSCKKMNCDTSVDQFNVKLNSLNGISGAILNH